MCVAAPGTVIAIEDSIAKVDYEGNIVNAHTGIIDVKVGDRVLVHAGMILQILSVSEAEEMELLFRELEEADG